MTVVRTFHGTEAGDEEQESSHPQSQQYYHQDDINMSLTYSDFLYALPPLDNQVPRGNSTMPGAQGQGRLGHAGSTNSIFSLGSSPASYLPAEFQVLTESEVPLLQTAEVKDEDFVIIAEFSELEGPIPLCTIPFDAPDTRTDINLNSLSVHLMSTDYQVNTVGQFKVCEDTQVMRTNVFPHVHVFMQYFTLYDIKARGFVRPFCFGYVSKDHVKLERNVQILAYEFSQMSKVLKCANRRWFGDELSSYMNKLSSAKENFISRVLPPEDGEGEDGHFYFESGEYGSDPISLSQIAFQFTEIENIWKEVTSAKSDSHTVSQLHNLESLVNANTESLSETLEKLNFIGDSFSSLNMPLVHPLKQKGESLRPITTLGQVGTLYLVQELMKLFENNREDIIFTEMTNLTQYFKTHCVVFKPSGVETGVDAASKPLQENNQTGKIDEGVLCQIVEKLHASVPIVSTDDRSASYHSLSDESEVQFPAGREGSGSLVENGGSVLESSFGPVENNLAKDAKASLSVASSPSKSFISVKKLGGSAPSPRVQGSEGFASQKMSKSSRNSEPNGVEEISQKASFPSTVSTSLSGPPLSTGFSSEDEDVSQRVTAAESPSKVTESCAEVEIEKIPWWTLAGKGNIAKGSPGYGIWKFFRRFLKIGHHILFSILSGRPVIVCASGKLRNRVRQLIWSLVPFVPCFPSKSFKILPWHQGTLSPLNFRHSYKLIGLCIPERSSVHDLVHSTEQNSVTVLDFEEKKILGPAYHGSYLKNFEEFVCQKKFFDDLSVLTYLGTIFTELESQVFMYKTIQSDGENNVAKIMKQLNLKNSDADIVKHLGSIIAEPGEAAEIF